jgi:hypothetical protein
MTAREKPHCGSSGVPFMKSTSGDASTAFCICARASEDRSLHRTEDVVVGDPRAKGASWSKHKTAYRPKLLFQKTFPLTGNLEIYLNMLLVRSEVESGVNDVYAYIAYVTTPTRLVESDLRNCIFTCCNSYSHRQSNSGSVFRKFFGNTSTALIRT